MSLNIIVATARNNVIGNSKSNSMPWHLPPDLKNFKLITMGCPVIMGRNTFQSLKQPLPGRKNIVVSAHPELYGLSNNDFDSEEAKTAQALGFTDLTRAILYCESWLKAPKIFIIGGGQIYQQALKNFKIDKVYKTEIDIEAKGDITFPALNETDWVLTEASETKLFDTLPYRFLTYDRADDNQVLPG